MALLWLSFIFFIIALVMLDLFVLRALRKTDAIQQFESAFLNLLAPQ